MNVIIRLNYNDYIFSMDEAEEALDFALTAALRADDNIDVIIRTEEEESDNEE